MGRGRLEVLVDNAVIHVPHAGRHPVRLDTSRQTTVTESAQSESRADLRRGWTQDTRATRTVILYSTINMYLNPKYMKIKYGKYEKMRFGAAHTPRQNMVKPIIAAMRERVKYKSCIFVLFFN